MVNFVAIAFNGNNACLLYTSDAADDRIKKKTHKEQNLVPDTIKKIIASSASAEVTTDYSCKSMKYTQQYN
ncbi:hypothetical protein N2056_23000, partial [Escherichia coli]|uniref:hypothetical protein n=1 Tax=Escherichia coli TaxID=562 RepID=UPI0022B146E9